MRLIRSLLILALLLPACAAPVARETVAPADQVAAARAAAASITADATFAHVAFLASDELRGRDTPSPGLERAAGYISDRFREWGVRPGGEDGGYLQRWPYRSVGLDRETIALELVAGDVTTRAEFGADFFLAPPPAPETRADLYFAGVAGTQPRPLPAEARGQFVAFYVPGGIDANWQLPVVAALQSALPAGAAGLLLILDPVLTAVELGQLAEGMQSQQGLPMVVAGVRYDVARDVFAAAGMDLDALRQVAPGAGPALERVPGGSVTARAAVRADESTPPNVVGIVEGTDPVLRGSYIVYSAHFDHVGVGVPDERGDSIYNGADDNASGTSAVLELARAFATSQVRPRRSMIFLLVSGEEKGLLGSMYFAENPTVPLESLIANINLDMVGRNAPDTIVAIGQDYTSLGPLVQRVNAAQPELGLTVAPDLWPEERLFFRSDHFSFAAQEIPAIFFTSGLHEDYHRPSDTAEKIDADKIARVARLVFHLGLAIAEDENPPTWTAEGLRDVRIMTGQR